jgi:N-acetylmuramoyl-L-alanine amidase
MNKKYFLLLLSLFVLPFVFVSKVNAQTAVSGHKVIIDAGHGGSKDTGSTECPTLLEKDANLQVAQLLETKLKEEGATVYMTRTDDSYLTNRDRYTAANKTDGEILVSIHFNGSTDHSINYTQGLYAMWKKDINLASTIHNQLYPSLGIEDGYLLQFASGVILKAEMPATIQEVAFISNTTECSRLSDGSGIRQTQIVQSLFNGINEWFAGRIIPAKPGK